jgi:hypothetical protein
VNALPGDLAIVSCHFNPCGYRARERNLLQFIRRMRARAVPVFIAELLFPGQRPLLSGSGNGIVVTHFHADDVMWHKERLLNLIVPKLPDRFTKVAWVDADIIFPDDRWYARASELLDSYDLAQLFDDARRLDNDGRVAGTVYGIAGYVARGDPTPFSFGKSLASPGLAWGAKRSLLAAHGLLDVMILGAADTYLALAAYGALDVTTNVRMKELSPGLDRVRRSWLQRFSADVRGRVGYLPTTAIQLGHGDPERRQYGERLDILTRHDFDPALDIAPGEGGVWRWSSAKPALHAEVAGYFRERREDDWRAARIVS